MTTHVQWKRDWSLPSSRWRDEFDWSTTEAMQMWLRNMCLVGSIGDNVRNHSVNGSASKSNHGRAHRFSHDA